MPLARVVPRQAEEVLVLDEMNNSEVVAQVRALVSEISTQDYPLVWVGRPGMTEEDFLELQEMNKKLPEYMRVKPGEFLGVEGSEEGLQIPERGVPKLSGLDVIRHLSGQMQEEAETELRYEVMHIQAAKQGKVMIQVSDGIKWVPKEQLTDEDMMWLVGVPEIDISQGLRQNVTLEDLPPVVGVWTGGCTNMVPLDELTPEYVYEDLLEDLKRYAAGETMGTFVIPETERVKAYLAEHGEYFE